MKTESDLPPGGDDYLRPFPEPGAVRPQPGRKPPQEVLEEQSAAIKKQAARQRD